MSGSAETRRRIAIAHLFQDIYGQPPETEWPMLISTIIHRLSVPLGSRDVVKRVFEQVTTANNAGVEYDANLGIKSRRKGKFLIKKNSPESNLICDALQNGLSISQATCLVNEYRRAVNLLPISWSTVEAWSLQSPYLKRFRRGTKKSGSKEIDGVWAIARVAQCKQYLRQLELGHGAEANESDVGNPMRLHEIVWWDEKHQKTQLGCISKHETLVCRDETGALASPGEGGVFPARLPTTTAKFPKEARFCFGVALRINDDGSYTGLRALPYEYTCLIILGPNKFEQKVRAELSRVKGLKGCWANYPEGYEQRFPETWPFEVARALKSSEHIVSVTELMSHVVSESRRLYAGTSAESTFMIFHDGLSQWWEPGAQEYLANVLCFPLNRQLRCEGNTNADNRYYHKVVGDSPELCRALDSHGFADLKRQLNWAVALSSTYPIHDPRRFGMGTPKEVASSLRRCWEIEPTSERIIEDILAFPRVLQKIIDANGCVVLDEFLRTGRRYLKVRGQGECKIKPCKKQRKETLGLPPIHPDCFEAYSTFTMKILLQQVQTAQQIAAEEPLENDSGNELNLTDKPIAATEMN
jgi:hypothetical protein